MYTRKALTSSWSLLGTVAVVCTLFGGNIAAKDREVTVAIHVSAQGLDLRRPPDAQTFYTRLKNAAWSVCARPKRVQLVPVDNPMRCAEQSLAAAIRSTNLPMLTRIYLETHSLQEAAQHGIEVPALLAGK